MGRRKSKRKPPPKRKAIMPLDQQFNCLFCNHEKSCEVKMWVKFCILFFLSWFTRKQEKRWNLEPQICFQKSWIFILTLKIQKQRNSPSNLIEILIYRDKSRNSARIACRVCAEEFQTSINFLSEPVDVYNDWVDACEESNKNV